MSLTKNEHLTKSFQNERFATTLDTSEIVRIEWAITAMFYAALHFVQAYFVSRSSILPLTHKHRDTAIQRAPLISGASHDYRRSKN